MLYFSLPQICCSSEKLFRMAVLHISSASTNFSEQGEECESLALATKCFSDTPYTHISLAKASCMTTTNPKGAEEHISSLFPEEEDWKYFFQQN